MARFEQSRERNDRSGSGDSRPRRDSRDRGEFSSDRGGFGSDRRGGSRDRGGFGSDRRGGGSRDRRGGSDRDFGRPKRDIEMTKVTCSACGIECEVPFKPTSTKPVYCSNCYSKNNSRSGPSNHSSSGPSNKDIDMINEKLNKIMKALEIE